jgi:pyruvate dehydrogenase E2 component (dihydrolipoamide acetyltransferase)
MIVTIAMPQLGLTMTEATVSTWLKKPGDEVKKDEPVLSVSTDKVDMDIESTVDGVLREILIDAGQTVPVGTPLAYVAAAGENAPALSFAPAFVPLVQSKHEASLTDTTKIPATNESNTVEHRAEQENRPLRVSPRAKQLASQLGIDLTRVQGSGPSGRIIEQDIRGLSNAQPTTSVVSSASSKRRQVIADRMVESLRNIPPFTVSLEVDAEKLVSLYQSLRDQISRHTGHKLTYTDLLFRALALSLANTPQMNAVWDDGAVIQRNQVDLGLAVATDLGVVAPVLTNIERLPLVELVTLRSEITERARQSRLTLTDLGGGAGTLSNLGMYRVDSFAGIISPGQSFILTTGKLRNRPWVDSVLTIKPTVIVSLTVDHRVADGVTAAIFLERIAEVIENPYLVLWNEQN